MGYTEIERAGEITEVKVNIDGKYTVNAYMLDETGMQSGMSNVVAFSRDQDPPNTAVITMTDITSSTLGVLATRLRCSIRSKKLYIPEKCNKRWRLCRCSDNKHRNRNMFIYIHRT